jgi:mRNA-degrading endonuclease RelE of RelBE toxin-antitoxin system
MAKPYDVELTVTAEETYARISMDAQECIKVGDLANSKVILLKQVDEVIDTLIPHDPFNPQRALRGPLSNIYSVSKGRMRVCYVGSPQHRKIAVLYFTETPRKAGNINDPYSVFARLVLSGKFDEVFIKLGVRRPIRQAEGLAPLRIQ